MLFGSCLGPYRESEIALARQLLPVLGKDMLCLAGRNFFGYPLWKQARGTGADLLWRVKKNLRLPVERRCADGSYLSRICSREQDRRRRIHGIQVRVIEYRLEGAGNAEPFYRLLTSLLDPAAAPAPNWRRSTPSAGRLKRPWTNSRRTGADPRSCCAARRRSWCAKSFGGCCWRILRFVI